MNKTIITSLKDFKDDFQNIISKSGLPAAILVPIVQNYLYDLKSIEYQEYLKEEENNTQQDNAASNEISSK